MFGFKKIGEGRYRDVYLHDERCYKVLKPVVKKQYAEEVSVDYPLRLY